MSWLKKLIKQLEANQLQSSQDKISYIVELHKKNKFKTKEEVNSKE
ncbi:MAG: hypothetical protein ACJ0QL_07230 [Parvicellaceae bacterium]|tara:strand:+ start:346 stop:483 length:138 start_codon:yes stop_codon:yes gene_type:complete